MSRLGIEVYKPFVGSSEVARKGLRVLLAFVRRVVNRFTHEVEVRDFSVENLRWSKRTARANQIARIAMLSVVGIAKAFAPDTANNTQEGLERTGTRITKLAIPSYNGVNGHNSEGMQLAREVADLTRYAKAKSITTIALPHPILGPGSWDEVWIRSS